MAGLPADLRPRELAGVLGLSRPCFRASAGEAFGYPIILVGDCQKIRTFPRFIKGIGLLSQVSGGVSISAGPSLGLLSDFHWHSGCWLNPIGL